ncbi:MAG TPA: class I SAM-dependent methyltransferase [Legionella sp.]|nr:class I SAM-dependent methyltransferase [Legionella sp.]
MTELSPKLSFDKIAENYAHVVDTKPIHLYYERPNLLSLMPDQLAGLNILDLGCGTGWYTEHLTGLGAEVTAADASSTMINLTQQRVPSCHTVLVDLEESFIHLSQGRFDIIIAPLVIHYIKDWYLLFSRLSQLLKPKGSFIFSTHVPYTEYMLHSLDNYFKKVVITENWENIGEVKFYHHTLNELTEALYQADFLIERMLEPKPLSELKDVDPKSYNSILTKPWFLFVKAIKK